MKNTLLLALFAALISACTTSPTGRSQLMLISPEAAIVESKKAYLGTVAELDKKNKLVSDRTTVERVQTITGRLVTEAVAAYPNTRDWEWSVAIIDDMETINAWCMAGGRMAIYTGIISKLDLTDDELAQIMGHEISHAVANHTAERMSRAMAINLGVVAAGAATDNNALTLTGAALAAKLALELPNSRTAELEADRLGMELATRAGYDPAAAASLWRKMAKVGGSGGPEFLSTHPAPGNREKSLTKMVPEMQALNPKGKKSAVYPVTIVK
ncbi:M48 family metallopeptidase [Simiduia sp. 21SJ11W-1]|uniref:M48 family metallopeptidase n=1 Tax=Simiduia sp. 21SJ11W-1 TaxID=2909669 RepID=UPI00209F3142|nr:M48 family metallopeptidase [Simiduia sp. 21SJ11W-1]UTA47271.1 M48 family metallopeptidase [Simiduia sp. 21SJ11W-1]